MEKQKSNQLILTERDEYHKSLMVNILKNFSDTPLVLKGGTALFLGYGLTRFSEDLDFDSAKKLNLLNRMTSSTPYNMVIDGVYLKKDTDTVSRYIVSYHVRSTDEKGRLKIEISYRTPVTEEDVIVKDGIRFSSVRRIIDNKLNAAYDGSDIRAKGRDLFDLHFLAHQYPDYFDLDLARRLQGFTQNPDKLVSLYSEDVGADSLLNKIMDVEQFAIELNYMSNNIVDNILRNKKHTLNKKIELAKKLHSRYLNIMDLSIKEKEDKKNQLNEVIKTASLDQINRFIGILRSELRKAQERTTQITQSRGKNRGSGIER